MHLFLIKNNIKLMLRNKAMLIVMAVLPVVVISLLSSIFEELLNDSYEMDDFVCGYSISESSGYKDIVEQLEVALGENQITLKEYASSYTDYQNGMENNEFSVFVDIADDKCTIYKNDNKLAEAVVVEYIFSNSFSQYNDTVEILKHMFEQGKMELNDYDNKVNSVKLDADPIASSVDYYGIIYVIFFSWCTPIVIAVVLSAERFNKLHKRFGIAPISKTSLYVGKLVPGIVAGVILTLLSTTITTLIFGIKWGNYAETLGILLLQIFACNALGIVIFNLFKNTAVSIAVLWMTIFFWGFIGGTFTAYMYSGLPKQLIRLSPLYYQNRTLVEFSTIGDSSYKWISVLYLLIIFVVFTFLGILLMNRKVEAES